MSRILIVEDDDHIRSALRLMFESQDFEVDDAPSGEDGIGLFTRINADVAVVDLMLPGISGFETCRELRSLSDIPIVIVSARDDTTDVVQGLESGADDYVTKPFAFEELLARVEALARRPRAIATPVLTVGDLTLDLDTREVRRDGRLIDLTPKEFLVLEYLMRHAGRVMSRTLITEYAWGYHFDPGTNIVDVVINHLRKKVDSSAEKKLIATVRGVGYVVKG